MLDLLIRNGTVIDGTGAAAFTADVGVTGDRISLVQPPNGVTARREIDAAGKIVCPGFIDPHSHADLTVFRPDHPELLAPLVRQGVTTFIGGNCGISMAPLGDDHGEAVRQYIEVFTGRDPIQEKAWDGMGSFLDTLESRGVLLNTAVLAPHGLLRLNAMGMARGAADSSALRKMAAALEKALEEGALGLSLGLQYFPGSQSDTQELAALGAVLKKYDGLLAAHLRSYSQTLPDAMAEIIDLARTAEIRGQISHIFWVPDYGAAGPFMRRIIRAMARLSAYWTPPIPLDIPLAQRIDQMMQARDAGVRIGMDVMPTTTGFTHLLAFFPPWALEGGSAAVLARLRDPEQRARIRNSIEKGRMRWPHREGDSWSMNFFRLMGWECCRIMAVASSKNKALEGRSLMDIARERRRHPLDVACDLLLEEEGHVLVFESMGEPEDAFTERSMFAPLRHPAVQISTDTLLMGIGKPSHLFYGCYPKFLGRFVREKRLLSLETAVHKITGLPADHFGLRDRGRIAEGAYADIVVFDPDTIAETATFEHPEQYPDGVGEVVINGTHLVQKGEWRLDRLPGKVLRRYN